ncbi:MAG TPA: phosphoribosylglycinamide formyltransferase, partial [Thermoleophilaceae bacterium]|nr:phosphoribosylglycinamide formyltransferase [Thermoleophilaceae bacterium]
MSFRIAVLVSGEGSNLQALIDDFQASPSAEAAPGGAVAPEVEIAGVAASRADARGLQRAEAAGIDTAVFSLADEPDRAKRDDALAAWLEDRQVDLVVLAGFMELLTPGFIRRFAGRIVNVHPALLPAFPGLGAIEQAIEHGVKVAGVTVHFVDEGVDSGPILLQEAFELPYHRDISSMREHFHE